MIKLTQPYISPEAIEKCAEVLKSGNLVQGKYVKEFEQAISEYLRVKHTIVVSSGTAALHLSLIALGIGTGDEVIVPAFSFPATANVIELVGAKPVFVDIKLNDFCIDTSLIESAITNKTKAIMPVHEFGQPADMKSILELADKYKLFIIEDAACAFGAEYEHNKVGTIGNIGCFSFHPRKAITTGEGGAITTNDDAIACKLISLRNHGIIKKEMLFDFIYPGFNYRLTDIQASLGICQIKEIERIILERKEQAEYYASKLNDIDWVKTPPLFQNRRMVFQSFHLLLTVNYTSTAIKNYLMQYDIETNIGAYAIPSLTYYKEKYNLPESIYENSRIAYTHGLVLPLGNHLLQADIDFIADKIKKYVG